MQITTDSKALATVTTTYKETDLNFVTASNKKTSMTLPLYGVANGLFAAIQTDVTATINVLAPTDKAYLSSSVVLATQATTAGTFKVTDINGLASSLTVAAVGDVKPDTYTIAVTVANTGSTQGSVVGTNNITSPLTGGGTVPITVDGGAPQTLTLAGTETSAQVVAAIHAQITGVTAQIASSKLKITSKTQGSSSSVTIGNISTDALGGELGVEDGSGVATVTAVTGTNGLGRYTITPESTGVATTYVSGTALNTAMPGLSLVLNDTTTLAGKKATVQAIGQIAVISLDLSDSALAGVQIEVDGGSTPPTIHKSMVRIRDFT